MARTGMPDGLIRRTTPLERNGDSTDETVDADDNSELNGEVNGEPNGESRGESSTPKPRANGNGKKSRKKRLDVHGRKFQLSDKVFERLLLEAIQEKTHPSAIVEKVLDEKLPKHFIDTRKPKQKIAPTD
jgi:hypothetical protein